MKNRLSVGSTVMFNAFPRTDFYRDYIVNGATCKVLANRPNTVRVLFRGQTHANLVAPKYLCSILSDKKS